MPWILAGGGVVVIAVVVVLIFTLGGGGGGDTGSPEGVAQSAVDAANDQDYEAIAELTCEGTEADVSSQVDPETMGVPGNVTISWELGEVTQDSDTEATANITMSASGEGIPEGMGNIPASLKLSNKDGDWCISSFAGPA
ncbi:MAG TPA: hypothetical protein VHH15_07685 [Actinophytocola sp.]|nr:hypothetical protein [Actinophytocola sp.]